MAAKWAQDVQTAFQGDTTLTSRILDAAHQHQGQLSALFGDIARHILTSTSIDAATQPAISKKRKLDASIQTKAESAGIVTPSIAYECRNVSFQVPVRKKLKLQIVADATDSRRREIRLVIPQSDATEFTLSSAQVDQIFCLPVPEKQQRQSNFVVFPQAGATNADGTPCEQMVFTLNETKPDDASSTHRAKVEGETYVTVTEWELNQLLEPYRKTIVKPTEAEFASSLPQPHRKGEKAYHIKAHRGTKEGYLFLLSSGILFGFKKPLSFFPFSSVESISYTSVLQRTFNLVISATEGNSTEAKDVEFSMLDQADFAGIDGYIKRHGLNDASMAAERRAKAYNVNKEVKKETNGDANGAGHTGDEDDGLTELQRAEQQLQDAEDDEEEDYEASGGESDGEGEESDEAEREYGEGADEGEYDEEGEE